jgi:beta-mannosidase
MLDDGWETAACSPDAHTHPGTLDELAWLPARVPGTAAGALRDAGQWRPGDSNDFDAEDWWFRTSFHAPAAVDGEEVVLELDGVATVAEIFLNGAKLITSDTMFATYALDVGALLIGENELAIRCRTLAPLLRQSRKPRARWRTRLVDGNLRFYRTMLLGRASGFAPSPAAVGPWRPVRLVRRRVVVVEDLSLRPRLESKEPGTCGLLSVQSRLRSLDDGSVEVVELELVGPSGTHRTGLALRYEAGSATAYGELRVPDVARWWPHTHGEPALHEVRLHVTTSTATVTVRAGHIGFRTISPGSLPEHDVEVDGLDLHINGLRVFARGALWTPLDIVALTSSPAKLRAALEQVRAAGMNMLRLPGTGAYETAEFHNLCDELGIMVWQDMMFANLDYPIADESFRRTVEDEIRMLLDTVGGRPSLAVLCGNSEVEQQVAMLGLDPALGRGELFGELLPARLREAELDAIYVPSAPCGGELPFRSDRGIANYYGVGGYRLAVEDARRAGVRFAAECLAFSNVPDEETMERMLPDGAARLTVHHPAWKAGVPRDVGTGWDFEDVRDHYLRLRYGVDPGELRRAEHDRYLELSRAVTGEVMAEVFGEWRRAESLCGGGLVLWLRDVLPGAGWGLLDERGAPKAAYHHVRRALAPIVVWMSDEGLGGVVVHVANDRPHPLRASLRIALYTDLTTCTEEASIEVELPAHGQGSWNVETVIGRFLDASWAYRFGPPAQDAIVASLEHADPATEEGPLSQAFFFPAGRPCRVQSTATLSLAARAVHDGQDGLVVALSSKGLAYGVRLHVDGHRPEDDAFSLEPDHVHTVRVRRHGESSVWSGGYVTAINLRGRVSIAAPQP